MAGEVLTELRGETNLTKTKNTIYVRTAASATQAAWYKNACCRVSSTCYDSSTAILVLVSELSYR